MSVALTTSSSFTDGGNSSLQIVHNKKLAPIPSSKLETGNYSSQRKPVAHSNHPKTVKDYSPPYSTPFSNDHDAPLDLSTPNKTTPSQDAPKKQKLFLNPTSTKAIEPPNMIII